MGANAGEQVLEIDAPPELCFETIVDYETFPDWQNAVESVEVIERDPDGRGRIVEFQVDAKFRKVTYRLGIDAGIPIPGLIARKLNGQVLKRAAEDLKREAERRAAG